MGVLGSVFAATYLSVGGSKAKAITQTPPINASSPDEESFIKYASQPIDTSKLESHLCGLSKGLIVA